MTRGIASRLLLSAALAMPAALPLPWPAAAQAQERAASAAASAARTHRHAAKVDPAIPDYRKTDALAGTVRSVGSSTLSALVARWSEEFRLLYPNVAFETASGGSGIAPPALMEGRADLAPMSRPMTKREVDAFVAKFGYAPTRVTVALDAIAVYVNKRNPLERITLKQLDGVYAIAPKRGGPTIRDWGGLGLQGDWRARDIVIKAPAPTHGMHGVFREMVLDGGEYRYDLRPEPVSTSIVQGVGADESAIGFASYFYATQRTRALAVAKSDEGPFVLPTQENCQSGAYPLARYLYVYVNRKPGTALPPATSQFLSFVCSKQGQETTARDGNFPLDAGVVAKECAGALL